jgi:bacillithiol synthase
MFTTHKISYRQTNAFSKLVLDYLDAAPALDSFYNYKADIEGLKKAVADRKKFPVNRKLLVDTLGNQYAALQTSAKLKANIESLSSENTFTICTAHQPNIFTGHLYFIYKILHAIKLCETLKAAMPENNFVPVYYMGSEDADLEELGEVHIKGYKYQWQTKQTGAVGRMIIDKEFIKIIDGIAGQLAVEKNGTAIVDIVRETYKEGLTIEQATFHFVHYLFNKYGLVVLLPDDKNLKAAFAPIITKELEEQFSEKAVAQTVAAFPQEYKVQASGRPINLFYLKDSIRERIEAVKNGFAIANTDIKFTKENLFLELHHHPERFSPNVILRPVFQEMILPNVGFIGGGGEIAYWLELKNVFDAVGAFFPALILRNSFTIMNEKVVGKMTSLGLQYEDTFKPERQLVDEMVRKASELSLDLNDEKEAFKAVYENIKTAAGNIDSTLNCHVHALRTQALNKLEILEKKMLKAEKKKFEAQQRQIQKLKTALYPNNNLQERVDNVLEYVSMYGNEFIDILYKNSEGLGNAFTILTEGIELQRQ